jgi:hypothetical protein
VRPDAPQCQSTASSWAGMSHGALRRPEHRRQRLYKGDDADGARRDGVGSEWFDKAHPRADLQRTSTRPRARNGPSREGATRDPGRAVRPGKRKTK